MGVALPEGAKQPTQDRVEGARVGEADFQPPGIPLLHITRQLDGALCPFEHVPCFGQEQRSGFGEFDRAPRPAQQQGSDLLLEHLDQDGQRWLGHAQALGGAPEVALFGDGHEGPEVTQLHTDI